MKARRDERGWQALTRTTNFPKDCPTEEPDLDDLSLQALRIHSHCIAFGHTIQILEGDDKKQHYRTRTEVDHAGLELMLRDVEPLPRRRAVLRDLVAWLATPVKHRPAIELPEGLSTEAELEDIWSGFIRRWL